MNNTPNYDPETGTPSVSYPLFRLAKNVSAMGLLASSLISSTTTGVSAYAFRQQHTQVFSSDTPKVNQASINEIVRHNRKPDIQVFMIPSTTTEIDNRTVLVVPSFQSEDDESVWDFLERNIGAVKGPADWAENLDKYLYR